MSECLDIAMSLEGIWLLQANSKQNLKNSGTAGDWI